MLLGVNVDHVATVREARKGLEPDPAIATDLAVRGGDYCASEGGQEAYL
jgi:pyridoxine 5-phosphate synthase